MAKVPDTTPRIDAKSVQAMIDYSITHVTIQLDLARDRASRTHGTVFGLELHVNHLEERVRKLERELVQRVRQLEENGLRGLEQRVDQIEETAAKQARPPRKRRP